MTPKMRPNTFFTILTLSGNEKLGITGAKSGTGNIPLSDLFKDLVAIGDPTYKTKELKSLKIYISDFKKGVKGCASVYYMPFIKSEYVDIYNEKLATNGQAVRKEFSSIVKKYLAYKDPAKMNSLINRLLYVIEEDRSISDEESFDFGSVTMKRSEFGSFSDITIDVVSILISVWTFILQHNNSSMDNDARNDNFDRYRRHRLPGNYIFPELNFSLSRGSSADESIENETDGVTDEEVGELGDENTDQSEDESKRNENTQPKIGNTMNVEQLLYFNGCKIGKVIQSGATVTENIYTKEDNDYD